MATDGLDFLPRNSSFRPIITSNYSHTMWLAILKFLSHVQLTRKCFVFLEKISISLRSARQCRTFTYEGSKKNLKFYFHNFIFVSSCEKIVAQGSSFQMSHLSNQLSIILIFF